jgi:hypothetical protein
MYMYTDKYTTDLQFQSSFDVDFDTKFM